MIPGSIVKVPGMRRRHVVFHITKADIARGINAKHPGLFLMTGMWYGHNPNELTSFGKIGKPVGRVVGHVRGVNTLTGARRGKFM